jgi:uncharacterized protein (DUF3084 family)
METVERMMVNNIILEKPLVERSIVGNTVFNMARIHEKLLKQDANLSAELERLTEERRQTRAAMQSLTNSLSLLKDDSALTDEERRMAIAATEADTERCIVETLTTCLAGEEAA